MSDTVYLIKRGDFMDIMIDNKIVGSSSWRLLGAACYFYSCESLKIKIVK